MGGVHTAQRLTPTRVPVGFCTDFIDICVGLDFGVWQSERTIKATCTDQQCFELLSCLFGLSVHCSGLLVIDYDLTINHGFADNKKRILYY